MIGVLDYELSNIKSVVKSLNYLGKKYIIIDDNSKFKSISKIIIPGVGSFKLAIENIKKKNYMDNLREFIFEKKKPILGICLGMQLLYESSEEDGGSNGLNFIPGKVRELKTVGNLKINNVGWRKLSVNKNSLLLKDINFEDLIFYFVHRYACYADEKKIVSASLEYNENNIFDAVIEFDNIFATQFHPEKSQLSGLKILKNFYEI